MLGRVVVTHSLTTTASPEAVWSAFEAAPRWPEVLTDLIEARIDGSLAAGAIIRSVAKPGTKAANMTYRVTAAEPAHRLVLETTGPDFRARTEYAIESAGTGARLTVTSRFERLRWLHRLTTALTHRHYEKHLGKAIVERTRRMLTLAERLAGQI